MELTAYVVLKFHEWAYSDLMDNTVRGDFAEYLVARALGLTSNCRKNWGPFDLKTEDGIKIEVKCSSSHQNWPQKKPPPISFRIPKLTNYWDGKIGEYVRLPQPIRVADVYVLCVLARQDDSRPDPLRLDDWTFHVAHKELLDEKAEDQASISITSLRAKLEADPELAMVDVAYDQLSAVVGRIGHSRPLGTCGHKRPSAVLSQAARDAGAEG